MRFDLDAPLLQLSPGEVVSGRRAVGGIHIFGGIGQGKTSASKHLASVFLRAGYGGLVTAVKPDEITLWQRYAQEHGRMPSLVLFDENEGFNFLTYELARQGMDGIGTVTECLMRVIDMARNVSPTASKRGGEAFWDDSSRNALRYALPVLYSARGSLTVPEIIRFITHAPANVKEPASAEWQGRSFLFKTIQAAMNCPKVPMSGNALQNAIDFWSEQWPAIPDKTRGNIVITITAALDRFNHGRLNRAFCGKTTIVPELSFGGAVIVLAMPVLTWNEDGIIAQQLFKFFWQRAVLARNALAEKHRERPLFLWSDEAQETCLPGDGDFLGLCRQSKCAVVSLTQSLPAYYSKMRGDNPRDAAMNLVGKFNINLFHGNACPETNEYASRMIGKVVTRRGNYSAGQSNSTNFGMNAGTSENQGSSSNDGTSYGQQGFTFNNGGGTNEGTGSNWGSSRGRSTASNESRGYSESMEYAIEPGDFARMLKSGGPANDYEVTGIWFETGRVFKSTGTNYMLVRFRQ